MAGLDAGHPFVSWSGRNEHLALHWLASAVMDAWWQFIGPRARKDSFETEPGSGVGATAPLQPGTPDADRRAEQRGQNFSSTIVKLQAIPYDRGSGGTADPVPLLTLQVVGDEAEAPSPLPARLRAIEPLSTSGATKVAVKIERLGNEYMINGATHHAPPVVGKVGETQHWRVSNITYYDHPFHIHGFFFQVLNPRTNAPVLPLEWRDTVNIPQSGQLELLVKYDDRPGMWMYHCHILDHVETGFMGMLNVE